MTSRFVYTGNRARVIFGSGAIECLADELAALNMQRPMVLTTPFQRGEGESLAARIGKNCAGIFSDAKMHTPVGVTDRAMQAFANAKADGVVAFGGGSTIGLGKAIALRTDAPQIVVPTTYAGSEMTTIIGQSENGQKTTQMTLKVLPETVIYDVDFTLSLPADMTITSGMNAIAHAVEALYAQNSNPVLSLMAEEGVRAMVGALSQLRVDMADPQARYDALYGAWLCATCLGVGGVALHHKLCHVLGGTFDLPHAETHTVVLPHALAYNAPSVEPAMVRLRRAMGTNDPAAFLHSLIVSAGAATSLKALGMPEDGIAKATEIALKNPYFNPRPLTPEGIEHVIRHAWEGWQPTSLGT